MFLLLFLPWLVYINYYIYVSKQILNLLSYFTKHSGPSYPQHGQIHSNTSYNASNLHPVTKKFSKCVWGPCGHNFFRISPLFLFVLMRWKMAQIRCENPLPPPPVLWAMPMLANNSKSTLYQGRREISFEKWFFQNILATDCSCSIGIFY